MKKFPVIDNFLSCYFNPDWDADYNTAEEVVKAFAYNEEKPYVVQLIQELGLLLQEQHTKTEWYRLISDDFGCDYSLKLRNIDPVEWLKKVQKQLENELKLIKEDL